MKICAACIHYRVGKYDDQHIWAECGRTPPLVIVSPVTGQSSTGTPIYCCAERRSSGDRYCGPDGRFWQPAAQLGEVMTPRIVAAIKSLEEKAK